MQKLSEKLKNTPTDAPLVCSSVNSELNREDTLSAHCIVRSDNSHEVDPPQRKEEKNLRVSSIVYVLNQKGIALMPTTPRKARILLKMNKAKVVRRSPFTIQLKYSTGEVVQKVVLGIDSGAKQIGFSAVSQNKELISGTVVLDDRMKSRLDDRKMYRRTRRSRKWYRKPRFLNRTRKEGWLPPSIERRYQTHLSLIKKIKDLLPITKVIVEVGNFDIQKIKNPEVKGKDYQEGSLFGYNNTKSYILARENYKCQLCNKSVVGKKTNLHHIILKSKGGTDKADNLALLHEKCHDKLHKQSLEKTLKKNKQYKEATFMNIIKNRFQKDIDCSLTYGYITFCNRNALGLEKTHYNDAFVIAKGSDQERTKTFIITQKRKNNRCLQKNRKGFKRSIRKCRYSLRPKDLVKIDNKFFEVKGIHSYGKRVKLVDSVDNIIDLAVKKIEWVFHEKTLIWR